MKAILFGKVNSSLINSDALLDLQLSKLKKYADKNSFAIIDVFRESSEGDLGQSQTFLKILEQIEKQDSKVYVICYAEFYSSNTDIDKKFRLLLQKEKIEIKNYSHPCFREPLDNDIKIWRYLTLPKFLDLIQTNTLFFSRSDYLRSEDKSEGAYLTNKSLRESEKINLLTNKGGVIPHSDDPQISVNQLIQIEQQTNEYNERHFVKQNFINGWHMNSFENFAMWKIYSDFFGVCIQSTYQDLCDCFEDNKWSFYNEKSKIYIGEINYIDWNEYVIPKNNMFWPYIHKKKEFEYEKELRCLINRSDAVTPNLKVKINSKKLINNIYINPFAPNWFQKVVEDLCEKYGVTREKIIHSSLK